jgi:hypothetical protein
MYDIVFYYVQGHSQIEISEVKSKYPTAKFIELIKNNYVATAQAATSLVKTSKFWFIPVTIEISKPTLPYKVASWDEKYVHYEKLANLELFLIPKSHSITEEEINRNFFNDTKFVNFEIFYRDPKHGYEVFFLSYNEPNADENFKRLLTKMPLAQRIAGIKGIFNAHYAAAVKSTKPFFWVVDADAEIVDNFSFNYVAPPWDFDVTHIWKSKNPVNDLVYGNGGVKLIPRHLLLGADKTSVDIATSISNNIKVVDEISNINNFAVDEYSAWRSAFRECVKLSSRIIHGQVDEESKERLNTWCTVGADRLFGQVVIDGALAGRKYGQENAADTAALSKINDFEWLQGQFETRLVAIGNI